MSFDPVAFFSSLGLVPRPLFGRRAGAERPEPSQGQNLIFLDGVAASFALALEEQSTKADDTQFYDWAWSSNVSSHVEIATGDSDGVVLVRRWDAPGRLRRFTLRSVEGYAADFIRELEKAGPPRAPSAIGRALYLFQVIRDLTSDASGVIAIRLFHTLLRAASRASRLPNEPRERWLSSTTLSEVLAGDEFVGVPERLLGTKLYRVHTHFLSKDPTTGRSLHADLLLRHAAGTLYQEAHLEIERQKLLQLPLIVPEAPMPVSRREVVFTPPGLARVLVERAIGALVETDARAELRVLDPACGSGVFLVEALLSDTNLNRQEPRRLRLTGYDISEAAATMADLAVADAANELAEGAAQFSIKNVDALAVDWPEVDLVLMNPPFVSWQDLTDVQREAVLRICGEEQGGRPDLSMAFVTKALSALRAGGVLATVLPSSLLSTQSGRKWRAALAKITDVLIVGRFQGSDIFPSALVEPSILLLRKKADESLGAEPAAFLLSLPGAGDAALRTLRTGALGPSEPTRFDLYEVSQSELGRGSWLPRPFRLRNVARSLERHAATRVIDVFQVHQGIRTGANDVFVLDQDQFARLPKSERRFFRPLAGNKTIRYGRLTDTEFVFFPYDSDGLSLQTEAEVKRSVPSYFRSTLLPAKDKLLARARVEESCWWRLSEPRGWQFRRQPKLVSSYFGGSGKFAVDEEGDYVVGQGYAWLFPDQADGGHRSEQQGKLAETWRDAAWCYLALLNSRTFESLLSYYSYRVMGGQLDLSPRFVNQVPMPDFVNEPGASQEVASKLRLYGRRISSGRFDVVGQPEFEELAATAFGATAADFAVVDQ